MTTVPGDRPDAPELVRGENPGEGVDPAVAEDGLWLPVHGHPGGRGPVGLDEGRLAETVRARRAGDERRHVVPAEDRAKRGPDLAAAVAAYVPWEAADG